MEYLTIYRYLGDSTIQNHVCFSKQFRGYFNFILQLHLNYDYSKIYKDHTVILSNKDINLFLRTLKQEFGGITSAKNIKYKKKPLHFNYKDKPEVFKVKEITIKLDKCKYTNKLSQKTVYKTLCTYLRYLYEKDFVYILKRAIKAYRKVPNQHLLTYLYHAHKNEGYNSGHSVIRYYGTESRTKFVPIEDTSFKYVDYMSNVITLSSAHYHNHKLTDKEFKQVKKLIQW